MKYRSLVSIAAVAMALLASPALRASDADTLREFRDRSDIDKLMWNYVRALDTADEDTYANLYTVDGQFGSAQNAEKGRDAMKKMIHAMKVRQAEQQAKGEATPPMHHIITNPYVEFIDKDHVHFHAYWLTVFGAGSKDDPVRVAAAGSEYDELVRVDGHWLIKLRDVAPKN